MFTSRESRRDGGRRVTVSLLCVLTVTAALLLSSCGDDVFGPQIVDMQVTPDTISETEAFNQTHDVSIVVSGFEGEIVEANAFIQEGNRSAAADDFEVNGNTITLVGVEEGWFGGLQPGVYSVGGQVISDAGEDVTQLDLATVTITEN